MNFFKSERSSTVKSCFQLLFKPYLSKLLRFTFMNTRLRIVDSTFEMRDSEIDLDDLLISLPISRCRARSTKGVRVSCITSRSRLVKFYPVGFETGSKS